MSTRLKHILSVSLGSSLRDKTAEIELLGQRLLLDRRGTDGDMRRFASFLQQHDGAVDVLCIGGTNLGLHCGEKLYLFDNMRRLLDGLRRTPVVDGSGIKATLEPRTLEVLQDRGLVDWGGTKVLLSSSVDRFGMALALDRMGADVVYGDLMFGFPWPLALRGLRSARRAAETLLPVATRPPFDAWLQRATVTSNCRRPCRRWCAWADVLAGDFPTFLPHLPGDLSGKLVVANSLTEDDSRMLRAAGVKTLVTTAPELDGRAFATNVLEGVFVALIDKPLAQIRPADYLDLAQKLGWEPNVRQLN